MQKINKKYLIPPLIFTLGLASNAIADMDSSYYLLERDNDYGSVFDMENPIKPQEMLIKDNGNVRVKFNLDQEANALDPEACVITDKIEILTNRDIPLYYDDNGEPLASAWETVWQKSEIRNAEGEVDFDLIKSHCLSMNTKNSYEDKFQARGVENKWKFQIQQGSGKLDQRIFNESIDYQDAELRVSIIYFPKVHPYAYNVETKWFGGTILVPNFRSDHWQIAFKSKMTLSLHDTIPVVEEVFDHRLTLLPEITGWELPSAYHYDTQGNIGCFGIWSGPAGYTCLPAIEDMSATENWLANRHDYDVLIMCPGSIIPEHVDLEGLEAQGAEVPTTANQPFPQVMADSNYAWCNNVEKIERQWTDLTQITQEGWMISVNQQTGNLECLAINGVCANSLVDNILLSGIDTPEEALALNTLVLTGTSPDCHYQNGATFSCPSELLTESPSISSVVTAFQQTELLDALSLSFAGQELSLGSGESIQTHNRRLRLKNNGNLVLQHYVDGVNLGSLWAAGTKNTGAVKVTFQNDGNLVIRDANNTAIWATATHVGNGETIKLQGNGDLVIYATSGEPLWSTGTAE